MNPATTLTPERAAIVTSEWPAGIATAGILVRFNAQPGPQVDAARLACIAASLGLSRPPGFNWRIAPLSLAHQPVQPRRTLSWEPVPADYATVAAFARERGLPFRGWEDFAAINGWRERRLMPLFKRDFGRRAA